jgi:hypothetical protein
LARKVKFSYEYVYQYFKEHGCELLETEYVNNNTKMRFKCSCGNESYRIRFSTFSKGARCDECKRKRLSKASRIYTLEEVSNIFKERGCTLLEDDYKNTKQLLHYICKCGAEHSIRLTNFKDQGNSCPECKRKALSGENHYLYNPHLTDAERLRNKTRINDLGMKSWRTSVFKRDDYTCQCCSKRGNGVLNAHHLDGYNWCINKRTDITNGVTLCEDCHTEFHQEYGKGYNTREQYDTWIRNKHEQGA